MIERTVAPYCEKKGAVWLRQVECRLNNVLVGRRCYDKQDRLLIEEPVNRAGQTHGVKLWWYENGQLQLAEPYCRGLIHGTATQWAADGRKLGTYTLDHGCGFDIWRGLTEDGDIHIAEVHSLVEGWLHGYQWWFNEDHTLYWERHWHRGKLHGIEREWNDAGRVCRASPKYWVNDQQLDKRRYIRACLLDGTLPPFDVADRDRQRRFPKQIRCVLEDT